MKPQPLPAAAAADSHRLSREQFEALGKSASAFADQILAEIRQCIGDSKPPTKADLLVDEVRRALVGWFMYQEFERGSFDGPAPWDVSYSRRDELRRETAYRARFWRLTVNFNRWRAVYLATHCRGLTWDDAYQAASASCNRVDFAGSPRTMKAAYLQVQDILRQIEELAQKE